MTKPNDFFSDDLSDLLGDGAAPAPRQLPQDEAFARIRQSGIGHVPAAPAFKINCQKCGGSGRFRSYNGRDVGPCFTCKGQGSFERKTNPTVLAANREKAAVRKVNSEQQNWDAFFAAHSAKADVLVKGAKSTNATWSNICNDIIGKVRKYGDLHEGTMAMLDRAVEREKSFAAKRVNQAAERQEQVAGIDVANIVACFQRAKEAGLKRFTLRFDGVHFQVDKHDWAKIWVSASGYGSAKYGLIQGNAFRPGRDVNAEILARIAEISKDPMAAAKAYAQITSSCSVCGIELTNKESIEEGMGPVCAGRLRRPGAMFVEVRDF